ncbi:hypothetical protein H2200_003464 [Cladophialophora chaetospira]|uniref:Heterokaryon incompatibility domain-containing protein n=1 Tax=Cladophialophora chaetospira TaxID=386627 RepID=A0AA39CMB3_9EURO|nr:hypothetical protein H2200_003464 [Cladophialophora chaetospira]
MESLLEVTLEADEFEPYERVTGAIIRSKSPYVSDAPRTSKEALQPEASDTRPQIRGRPVLPSINLNLIKSWMRSCESEHNDCSIFGPETSTQRGIRLIDVHREMVVLASQTERYVALSYVWGPNTSPMLTRDTVLRYSSPNSLKASTIPKTIFDAIQLVRNIGERYLWVDSLCIVQDDDSDKLGQLAIMGDIFHYAYLVVVASVGSDAYAGLPGVGPRKRCTWQHSEVIDGIPFITTQPAVRGALKSSVWNRRGWTFQEIALARPVLIFTENQVYWNCKRDIWREDVTCELPLASIIVDESNSIWYSVPYSHACRTHIYCDYAVGFSGRAFGEERDVLWAFRSILRMQESRFPQGFIWGLPYERLDATLLWSESSWCVESHPRGAQHNLVKEGRQFNIRFPSWSWLSTTSKIRFQDPCGNSIVSEISWHRPLQVEATEDNGGNSTGSSGAHAGQHAEISAAMSVSGKDIVEYGLLHFTAQTTLLSLQPAEIVDNHQTTLSRLKRFATQLGNRTRLPRTDDAIPTEIEMELERRRIQARIQVPSGETIGQITTTGSFFGREAVKNGELVLLSSNGEGLADGLCHSTDSTELDCGKLVHRKGCQHIRSHNIMLIEWVGVIAYRRGLTQLDKDSWAKVRTVEKRIVLG